MVGAKMSNRAPFLKIVKTEHQEQCAVIQWARLNQIKYPELETLHAIPNGGLRNLTVARKLKAEGTVSGIPDLHLPIARAVYHSLYIEMKRDKGKVSVNQKKMLDILTKYGNLCVICYSSDEAIRTLKMYLDLPND